MRVTNISQSDTEDKINKSCDWLIKVTCISIRDAQLGTVLTQLIVGSIINLRSNLAIVIRTAVEPDYIDRC